MTELSTAIIDPTLALHDAVSLFGQSDCCYNYSILLCPCLYMNNSTDMSVEMSDNQEEVKVAPSVSPTSVKNMWNEEYDSDGKRNKIQNKSSEYPLAYLFSIFSHRRTAR